MNPTSRLAWRPTGVTLPTGLAITHPYRLDWSGNTQVNGRSVGPGFNDALTFPRYEAEPATVYFAEGTGAAAAMGSAYLRHIAPDGRMARIAVLFVADIAAVTRDKDGNVIAGSLDDAIESRDVWTFSRNTASKDPNWILDETDEG